MIAFPSEARTAQHGVARDARRGFNRTVAAFFSVAARAYDQRTLQRTVYQPPQDEMIELLRRSGSRRIVDIGCGTGILTTRIAEELDTEAVYGIDMSPGMLARARQRSLLVHWRNEPAEQLSLPDESVDAVITTTAFHFFNQHLALAEFHRVLKPGGLLAIDALNLRARWAAPMQWLTGTRLSPAATPSPQQMVDLITFAGFELSEQRSVRRPWYSRMVPDVLTVAIRR
ncbi:class I SAM-dependent methyltransferase [Nocardia cyriacigeorgica]|uniref:Class I SAM-dependent methyltransferase n=1 Tax=Nocardia cyriacigeorgica TaxID=135487 RepID=A0A5R8P5K7_9NOCA|nr:class I SAM-dependent methyltransferase [Nocardia cyriacigeorgica]TLF94962.1 class I SAM-dependent methyltransferase [Nocardia cyriacigeorgica]